MFNLYGLDERYWKRWQTLADQCQRLLTEPQIVPGSPGTILKDVDTLLEFVGLDGIVTKSRNASLPTERLPELNLKSSHPIELGLKRALLRDYPNLAGIFILLRVMDLLQMKGNRLLVCPAALEGQKPQVKRHSGDGVVRVNRTSNSVSRSPRQDPPRPLSLCGPP